MMLEKDNALEALLRKPAFASLGEQRINLFRQFAKSIDGKSPAEAAARFIRFNTQISKEHPLSAEERAAVSAAIKESLSEEDRRKYSKVLGML